MGVLSLVGGAVCFGLFFLAMAALWWADKTSGPQWNEADDEAAEEDRRRLR